MHLNREWLKKHWIELTALAVGVLGLLYLYMRSRGTPSSAIPAVGTGQPAGTGSSGGGSSSSPVDLSGITSQLDALTQAQQAASAAQMTQAQNDQSFQQAMAQELAQLQTNQSGLLSSVQQGFGSVQAGQGQEIAAIGGFSDQLDLIRREQEQAASAAQAWEANFQKEFAAGQAAFQAAAAASSSAAAARANTGTPSPLVQGVTPGGNVTILPPYNNAVPPPPLGGSSFDPGTLAAARAASGIPPTLASGSYWQPAGGKWSSGGFSGAGSNNPAGVVQGVGGGIRSFSGFGGGGGIGRIGESSGGTGYVPALGTWGPNVQTSPAPPTTPLGGTGQGRSRGPF